jgi:hypothetical protein
MLSVKRTALADKKRILVGIVPLPGGGLAIQEK